MKLYSLIRPAVLFMTLISALHAQRVRDVAIYDDRDWQDGGAWWASVWGIRTVLDDKGYSWESVDASDLNGNDNLGAYYKLIIFPGGWAGGYNEYINQSGYQNLRNFISGGGSYLGMCAGAFFACDEVYWREGDDENSTPQQIYDYPLNLWAGIGDGVIRDFVGWTDNTYFGDHPGTRMTDIKIDSTLLPEADPTINVLYFGGPVFRPNAGKWGSTKVIARYDMDGYSADEFAAMILFPYGSGRVFLSAVHPEISVAGSGSGSYLYYNSSAHRLLGQIVDRLLTPQQSIPVQVDTSKLLRFETLQGELYQLQSSDDGLNWSDYGSVIRAEGFEYVISIPSAESGLSFRIQSVQ